MNRIKAFCKERYEAIKEYPVYIILGLTYAMDLLYRYNYLQGENVTEFDRSISLSLLMGLDYNSRIKGTYFFYGIIVPVVTIILAVIFSIVFQKNKKVFKAFKTISYLSIAPLLVGYICKYANSEATEIIPNRLFDFLLVFMGLLLFLIFIDREEKLSENNIYQYFILLLMGTLTVKQYLPQEIEGLNYYLWYIIKNGMIPVILTGILVVMLKKKKEDIHNFFSVGLMATWLPFMTRVIVEISYTLINNGHHVGNIRNITLIISGIYLCALLVLFLKKKIPSWFTKIGYAGALMSTASLVYYSGYQQTLSLSNPAVLYEIGNYSSGIDSYLYGKLPILDYFSAHALYDVVVRLLSALLNHDLLFLYSGLPSWEFLVRGLMIVFLYSLLKEFLNEPVSVIFILLLPCLVTDVFIASFCYLPIITSLSLYRKKKWPYYILWWLSLALSAFWTYDHGVSIGIACIIAIAILTLLKKVDLKFSRILLSGLMVGCSLLVFSAIHLALQDISIISRLKEWLSLSVGSSSSWAVAQIGDATTISYFICYVLTPFMTFGIFFFLMKNVIKTYNEKLFIPLVFSLTVILYINRTIVYHTLSSSLGTTGVTLNYFPMLLVFFAGYLSFAKHDSLAKRTGIMSMTLVLCIYVIGVAVTSIYPNADSSYINVADSSAETLYIERDTSQYEGQDRLLLDEYTTKMVNDFSGIFDTLLEDDQTYVDFANATGLYGLVGRQRPSYVSELPSLLSDEYSQECFLEDLQSKYDAPLALIGNSSSTIASQIAGAAHNIRYYKIAEYLYQNYRPLASYSIYTVWCKKDEYETMKDKLESFGVLSDEIQLIDYGFDAGYYQDDQFVYDNPAAHDYTISNLPYIWAKDDIYDSVNNEILEECTKISDTECTFTGSHNYVSENYCGNYVLLDLDASEGTTVQVILRNGTDDSTRYQYTFNIASGDNKYLLRVSQDSFWYAYDINDIQVVSTNDVTVSITSVSILQGD